MREPTQSMQIDPPELAGELDPEQQAVDALLALGTHNRPVTALESPRSRTSLSGARRAGSKSDGPRSDGPRSDDAADRVGAVLGSYRVLELLGKGGMGYVYRAEHIKLGREVALKVLRHDYASRRDAVSRFFQEARTVNRVRHRNIVDVTDFVELDDGTTYIVMELLTGTSLGAWAGSEAGSGIVLPRALAVLVQICDGLAAAHQVGVIHRDLKPDNVIVVPTADGAELVKLLDFGVAKLVNRDDEDVGYQTAVGSVIGTPAYMSPEQAGGMPIDARSDIYSLGAIMYELFSGQPMFRGRSFGEYVRKHLTEMPIPLRDTPGGAQIDPRLEALIVRCLDKDPEQRFAQITELREALLGLLGSPGTDPRLDLRFEIPSLRPAPMLPIPQPLPLPPPPSVSSISRGLHSTGGHASGAAPMHLPPGEQGYLAPLTLSGEYSLPPAPVPARAPAWRWFAGGAAAVGLGIAAAIWYAGRTPNPTPSTATPSAAAAAPSAPRVEPTPAAAAAAAPDPAPVRPARVEVRFDATPSGGVFAEGSEAELCRTPCAFEIDPSDGGAIDHRAFVVRRAGYVDRPITVDLTGGQREFQVAMQPKAVPAAKPDAKADAKPDSKPDAERRPARRGRPARKDTKAREAAKVDAKPDSRPDAKPDSKPDAEPPATSEPPRDRKAGAPPIDPADTLDPFRKK